MVTRCIDLKMSKTHAETMTRKMKIYRSSMNNSCFGSGASKSGVCTKLKLHIRQKITEKLKD